MKVETIHSSTDFSNSIVPENSLLLFVASDTNNNPVLSYKDSSGQTGVFSITADPNFIANNIKYNVDIAGVTGAFTGDGDATAGDILSGKKAYVKGQLVTGEILTVQATLSANVVTVPKGYIASAQTLTVPEAGSITTNNLTVTVPVGYIASTLSVTLTDANLIAANIKSGVVIFGVEGSYTSDATATAATILSGYTAYANGQLVTGEYTPSSGESGGGCGPLYLSMSLAGNFDVTGGLQYVLMYPSSISQEGSEMGESPGAWAGNFVSDTVDGVATQVLEWPDQDYAYQEEPWNFYNYWLNIPIDVYNFIQKAEWTIECWSCFGSVWNGGIRFLGAERYDGPLFSFRYSPGYGVRLTVNDVSTSYTAVTAGTWYHLAATRSNGVIYFWINGISVGSFNMPAMLSSAYSGDYLFCGYKGSSDYKRMKLSQIKVSTEALYS